MRRPTSAHAIAVVALVASFSGTAWAAHQLTGRDIRNGSLTGADIKDGSIHARDVSGLMHTDFKPGELAVLNGSAPSSGSTGSGGGSNPSSGTGTGTGSNSPDGSSGPQGPPGPRGFTGPTGATGATGPGGPQGPQGAKGDTGAAGTNGVSGYVPAAATAGTDATCATGTVPLAGGYEMADDTSAATKLPARVLVSRPTANGWHIEVVGNATGIKTWVVCAKAG